MPLLRAGVQQLRPPPGLARPSNLANLDLQQTHTIPIEDRLAHQARYASRARGACLFASACEWRAHPCRTMIINDNAHVHSACE